MTPLEVWDLVVDGVPLYRVERGPGFGAALARAAELLAGGRAVNEAGEVYPDVTRSIRRVALVGGAAHAIAWTGALPVHCPPGPDRCAERGGLAILERLGVRGLVADLGQSGLKIASTTRRRVHPRDLARIPISRRPVDGTGRAELVAFVGDALREAARADPPDALVLALPCEIADDGAPGTCSYPWRAGEAIVPEFLAAAGLRHIPTLLLNDAELAAIGVAEISEVAVAPTLVLTLGFGVGGALLRPSHLVP